MEKFVVANWKMHRGSPEDLEFLKAVVHIPVPDYLTVILAVPYTLLQSAREIVLSKNFYLGAQDCSPYDDGPYTGDVSAFMLRRSGCMSVILGHSERRRYHHETSEMIQKKASIACEQELLSIVCVGECEETYATRQTFSFLKSQIEESIPKQDGPFCIAYEPIWAIGSGRTPDFVEISLIHDFIKRLFKVPKPILYGGSVTHENARDILSTPHVDGLLVGGSSIKFDAFRKILEEAGSL